MYFSKMKGKNLRHNLRSKIIFLATESPLKMVKKWWMMKKNSKAVFVLKIFKFLS